MDTRPLLSDDRSCALVKVEVRAPNVALVMPALDLAEAQEGWALGHLRGMSGAWIALTAAEELDRLCLCGGVGQGIMALPEREQSAAYRPAIV